MTNPIKTCPGCNDANARASIPIEQQCTSCRKKERNRIWRIANPSAMAANAKRWREAGNVSPRPPEYAEQHRQYVSNRYRTDPEVAAKTKAAAKKQREAKGKDVLNTEHKAWLLKNPGKTREYYERQISKLSSEERRNKGKTHREIYRAQRQAGMAAYYARRQGATGIVSNEHLFYLHKWQDHCCYYCRNYLDKSDTIEHGVPLSRNGSNNPWNVVLACLSCNSRKSDKIYHIEWRPEAIAETTRHHSVYATMQLRKLLYDNNIQYSDCGDHINIQERPVFILSSFWLGWKGDSVIAKIKNDYPTSIIFFDKEFARRPDAVLNVLKAKAGISERIGARKLILESPSSVDARAFIGKWHAMGETGGTHYLGLRDSKQWWIVAAFRKEADRYEIIRMAIRETVAGGVSRIVEHFRRTVDSTLPLVAFTDQRMGDGKSHFFAGFEADGTTEHSFFYATPEATGFHPRRDFQKQVLEARAEFFDPDRIQADNAKANLLMRVEGLPRLRFVSRV